MKNSDEANTMEFGSAPVRHTLAGSIIVLLVLVALTVRVGDYAYFVPIGLASLVLGALLIIKYPGVLLAAYLYIPFYKNAIDPYLPVDITPLLAVACIVAASLSLPTWFDARVLSLIAPWLALLGLIAFGTAYAVELSESLITLVSFIALVFLPLLLGIRVVREKRLIHQFLIVTAIVSIGMILAGVISLAVSTFGYGGRLRLAASNTIGISRAAMLFPIVVAAGWHDLRPWIRNASLALIPIAFLVGFSAGSRGPLLMAVITILLLQLWNLRYFVRITGAGVVALVVAVTLFQVESFRQVIPSGATARFTSLFDAILGRGVPDRSISARLDLYNAAIDMFAANPLIGMGTSTFHYFASRNTTAPEPNYPHNLFLQVVAEFGMLGLVLVTWFLMRVGINTVGRRFNGAQIAIIGLAIFAFLNSMVSNGIYDNRWMWGMLLMAGAVTGEPLRRRYAHRRSALAASGRRTSDVVSKDHGPFVQQPEFRLDF